MRRLTAILFLFASIAAMAGNVSQEEALKKAQDFMKSRTNTHHRMRLAAKSTQMSRQTTLAAQESYYVFNVGEQDGFIVVSGDDRTPAILGYAEEGAFDANSIPENMKAWLQGYADQMAYMAANRNRAAAAVSEHQAIAPLLRTLWNQGDPYNNMCPMDGGERSATGCVATGMAQIINYHKHPAKTTKVIPAYTTNTKKIKVDAIQPTDIDWDNMLDYYTGNETAEQKQAVANLMLLCGASLQMDYTNYASTIPMAYSSSVLKEYFDFDDATRNITRDNYSAAAWDAVIYNELANKRPVFYGGQSTGGGHSFVVDGYDRNGLYHVNWGWGGSSDGYFLLSILDSDSNSGIGASSSTDGFSYNQEAVIGIQPNTGAAYQPEVKLTTRSMTASTTTVKKTNGMFPITYVSEIRNTMGATYSFTMGTGIYNSKNELVWSQILRDVTLDDGWGYNAVEHHCNLPSLPDGTYVITDISRKVGTDTWYQNVNSDKYYLTATVSGNTLTLKNPTVDLSATISTAGNMEVGSKLTVTATIKNNGTFFNDVLFLMVDGVKKGGRYFEAEAGETKTLDMTFYPEEAGNHTVSIAQRKMVATNGRLEEKFFDIASATVTVNAASSHSLQIIDGVITNAIDSNINDRVAILTFTVKNNDTRTYNDDLQVYSLIKQNNNTGYFDFQTTLNVPITVAALQSEQMRVEIPLQRDGTYWFGVAYKSNGEFKDMRGNDCLSLVPYQVVVPPIELGVETVEAGPAKQTVYNINGQKVKEMKGKGMYIINGKKVIKR